MKELVYLLHETESVGGWEPLGTLLAVMVLSSKLCLAFLQSIQTPNDSHFAVPSRHADTVRLGLNIAFLFEDMSEAIPIHHARRLRLEG